MVGAASSTSAVTLPTFVSTVARIEAAWGGISSVLQRPVRLRAPPFRSLLVYAPHEH